MTRRGGQSNTPPPKPQGFPQSGHVKLAKSAASINLPTQKPGVARLAPTSPEPAQASSTLLPPLAPVPAIRLHTPHLLLKGQVQWGQWGSSPEQSNLQGSGPDLTHSTSPPNTRLLQTLVLRAASGTPHWIAELETHTHPPPSQPPTPVQSAERGRGREGRPHLCTQVVAHPGVLLMSEQRDPECTLVENRKRWIVSSLQNLLWLPAPCCGDLPKSFFLPNPASLPGTAQAWPPEGANAPSELSTKLPPPAPPHTPTATKGHGHCCLSGLCLGPEMKPACRGSALKTFSALRVWEADPEANI